MALARPSSAIWATLVAWAFVNVALVATTAIVVFCSSGVFGITSAAGEGAAPSNSFPSSRNPAYKWPVVSNVRPLEFTATIAPTMMPLAAPLVKTVLAVPSPPLTPPDIAPAPAPTFPCWTGPACAAWHAFDPNDASGRNEKGAHRPGSNRMADGTIGT